MRRPSGLVLAICGVVAIVVAGIATGVVAIGRVLDPPSPTSTVYADDGTPIELDWRDYPGNAWDDPDDVLDAPRAEDVEAVGADEQAALQAAIEPVAPELDWGVESQPGVDSAPMPSGGGNDYGGATMHWIYNSPTSIGAGLAADADRHAIVAALAARLAELGYDPIEWDFDRAPFSHETQAERDAEIVRQHGSLDMDAMWMWSGSATHGSMWAWITIWDQRIPSTPADAWPDQESGVSIFLGGTIISQADERAYREGVAPYDGLARPTPTHSN